MFFNQELVENVKKDGRGSQPIYVPQLWGGSKSGTLGVSCNVVFSLETWENSEGGGAYVKSRKADRTNGEREKEGRRITRGGRCGQNPC